jgi:hypothetical protein
MPGWKINCLKSEHGTNPSTTTDEPDKTESIPSPTDQLNTGKLNFFRFGKYKK